MSSGEEDYGEHDDGGLASAGFQDENNRAKKRRIQRACDICRRKKIKCDGGQMPGNKCSNCIAYSFSCTYVEAAKKRGPPKGYVESLENRLEKMEKLLQRLCPDADFTKELGAQIDRNAWYKDGSPTEARTRSRRPSPGLASHASHAGLRAAASNIHGEEDLVPSDDDPGTVHLNNELKSLALTSVDRRFHGKSSGASLVQAAVGFKREYGGVADFKESDVIPMNRRPEYWTPSPWEYSQEPTVEPHEMNMPPQDLMEHLIDLYFLRVNAFHPLLHRPVFESQYRSGLHKRDTRFAAVILLICATASRYTEDPRVLLDHSSTHSAGWGYFAETQSFRKFMHAPPCLFDLQIYVLSTIFLLGTSAPHACWTMVGIGLRLAQDVGAHRNKVYGASQSIENELWKRAFWVLVALDRTASAAFGRPCAIHDEDFDVDLPLEIDDEYWNSPDATGNVAQPEGKPSQIAFFNCYVKLSQILAFALRTIYSINKSKILLGFVGPQWEQHIVAELDSALNKWIDSVPDHLRWDPNRENEMFFDQSAVLYATYYHIQILIHRPFIPSPKKPSPLSFPSLAICTNAARSCSHVLDIQRRRTDTQLPYNVVPAFTSGIVLLLNIWGVKKSASSIEPSAQLQDVYKCMHVLKRAEKRWHAPGRLWDILCELASVRDFPPPPHQPSPPDTTGKRERDSDIPISAQPVSPPRPDAPPIPRPIAKGPARLAAQKGASSSAPVRHFSPVDLPMNTLELSQLPLHPDYNQFVNPSPFPVMDNGSWYDRASLMTMDTSTSGSPNGLSVQTTGLGVASPFVQNSSSFAMLDPLQEQALAQAMFTPASSSFAAQDFPESQNPQQLFGELQQDTLAMWSTAPSGFEWDDWGQYIATNPQPPT